MHELKDLPKQLLFLKRFTKADWLQINPIDRSGTKTPSIEYTNKHFSEIHSSFNIYLRSLTKDNFNV